MTPAVRRALVVTVCVAVVVAAGQVIAYLAAGIDARLLLTDVAELAEVPGWYGAVSFLGIAGWLVAASAAGFAASLPTVAARLRPALTGIAALSLVLAADDRLQLHEGFARRTGLPELVVQASYGAVAVVLAWRYARDVRPEWPLFLVAALGLAVSLVVDAGGDVLDLHPAGSGFVEDNAKLLGILAWSAASMMLARRALGRPQDA